MLSVLLAVSAFAVPNELAHQGRLFDSSGAPLAGNHTVDFLIYDASTGGTVVWEEQQDLEFDDGYFEATLGASQLNPIEDADLEIGELYITMKIDSGTELPDRFHIAAVPFARRAGVAASISGGVVDASEIRVNGNTVIDGSGTMVGGTTLDQLTCSANEIPLFDGLNWDCVAAASSTVTWNDIVGVPLDLIDGDQDALGGLTCTDGTLPKWNGAGSNWQCATDDDTQLTEAEVEGYVTNGALDLAAGSSVDGDAIATASQLDWTQLANRPADFTDGTIDWSELANIPADLADGTVDWSEVANVSAVLSDGEVDWSELLNIPGDLSDGSIAWGEVTGIPGDLSDGSIDWAEVTGIPGDLADGSIDWGEVTSIPADLADGTIDWTEVANRPAGLDDGDDVLTEADVEGFVLNGLPGIIPEADKPWFIAGHSNTNWEGCSANAWNEAPYNTVGGGNSGGWYDNSTGRFTAPVTGLYLVVSSHYVHASSSGLSYVHHQIGVNGSQLTGGGRVGASYNITGLNTGQEGTYNSSSNSTRMLLLNAGDYVSTWVYCGGSGNYRYGNHSYFAASLLHAL